MDYVKQRDRNFMNYDILAKTSDDCAVELCNAEFTECKLKFVISQLKLGKSPGPNLVFIITYWRFIVIHWCFMHVVLNKGSYFNVE